MSGVSEIAFPLNGLKSKIADKCGPNVCTYGSMMALARVVCPKCDPKVNSQMLLDPKKYYKAPEWRRPRGR